MEQILGLEQGGKAASFIYFNLKSLNLQELQEVLPGQEIGFYSIHVEEELRL